MNTASELRTTKKLVMQLMESEPLTRNSDDYLYVLVCRELCPTILGKPFREVVMNRRKYNLPAFETVRRSRQWVQEHFPEFRANDNVEAQRELNEETFREFAMGVV